MIPPSAGPISGDPRTPAEDRSITLSPQEQSRIFGTDWDPAWQDEARERAHGPPRLVGMVLIAWGVMMLLGGLIMLSRGGGLYYLFCGVGSAAAKLLVERDFFDALVVADYSAERAEASARAASERRDGETRVASAQIDASSVEGVEALAGDDVAVGVPPPGDGDLAHLPGAHLAHVLPAGDGRQCRSTD